MIRTTCTIAAAVAVSLATALWIPQLMRESTTAAKVASSRTPSTTPDIVLASPGRIEGRSESIQIGAAIDGIVQTVHVKEGQHVAPGALLARIGCDDLQSAFRVANAEAESFRQVRARLVRGSRDEEREAAAQKTAAARAVLQQAASHLDRMKQLSDAQAVSRAVLEEAHRDSAVAEAELNRAVRNEELVNARALSEELAKADADIQAAEQRIKLTQDRLDKCTVRAPVSGSVLRVDVREGELYSTFAPKPLFTIADITSRRVRAEVDEKDIAKIRVGQPVVVSADAYPGRRLTGVVSRIGQVMGRKSVMTGDPADKSDRDVLEVLAELTAGGDALPINLRVTVQFLR